MRVFKTMLLSFLLSGASHANASLISVSSHFFQDKFANGGYVSGFFRGTDLNGDGRILSASPFLSAFTGVDISNELDYAEITFTDTGTSLGSQTLIYDKTVADVFSTQNFFFGFAYNIGSGSIGDEDDEGFSFSPFAPSTNYLLGALFLSLFIDSLIGVDVSDFGSCNGTSLCAAVLELAPDSSNPAGIRTVSQNLSSARVSVSEPSALGMMIILFGWLALRKCKQVA